jgi:hypothetical protein
MSGALAALQPAAGTYLVVGVADIGGGVFGFQSSGGTINGLTSAQNPPLRTTVITLCRAIDGGSFPFSLQVFGVVAQTFFKRLIVQKTDGTKKVLLSSDATFANPGGTSSSWQWTDSAAYWTAVGTKTVEVQF